MTGTPTTSDVDQSPSTPDSRPLAPNRAWLPAALTLLGSTGALSVFGPLTGNLYWEGFLAAFGMTPEEFPAAPSRVTVYAYNAILSGGISVFRQILSLWPWLVALVALFVLVSVALKSPKWRWRANLVAEAVKTRSAGHDVGSLAFQGITQLTLYMLSLLVIGYFVLVLALLALSPHQARQLGLREGERVRASHASAVPGSSACMSIAASAVAFTCPTVVAYGEKVIAVLDRSRIYRVNRDGATLESTLAPSAPKASGPSP